MNAAEILSVARQEQFAALLQRGRRMNAAEIDQRPAGKLTAKPLQRGRRMNAAEIEGGGGEGSLCRSFNGAAA